VIDWETAAIGPGYIDLVSISAGQWTPEQRQAMWRAYFEQYQAETGLPMDWEHFCQEVGQVALYRALWWLGWWSNGDANQITHWMQELINVTRETVGIPSA
jgi:thiamine kinase-like enzyme